MLPPSTGISVPDLREPYSIAARASDFYSQTARYELLIVDELGFVPLSKTGAELLFEMLRQRYERGPAMISSNLPFQERTEVLSAPNASLAPCSTG